MMKMLLLLQWLALLRLGRREPRAEEPRRVGDLLRRALEVGAC